MHKTLLIFCFQIASFVLVAQTVVLPPYFGVASSDFKCGTSKVVDSEGNSYATVQIGDQCWMAANLKYIPSVHPPTEESIDSVRYYVNDYIGSSITEAKATENYAIYGVLYNWKAASVSCPEGWHLPSESDWNELIEFCGGTSIAGGKMKELGTEHWKTPNAGADNETGFTALPANCRTSSGNFGAVGYYGYWWSASESIANNAWHLGMFYHNSNVGFNHISKEWGFSVRCIKD